MIKPRVLVVDDDYGASQVLQADLVEKLDPTGLCEFAFCSGQVGGRNAMEKILEDVASGWPPGRCSKGGSWALVLLDIQFVQNPPERDDKHWGFDVLKQLRERWPDLPVVMLTSEDEAKKTRANWGEADGFLPKPSVEADSARAFVTRLYAFGLFSDLRDVSRLAGHSLTLLKVLQEARQFACDPLGSGRILYGETGTGKTELARFIHDEMKQMAGRSGPFRTWSAVGVDEGIAKSALFGYWKGAHSLADRDEPGEIEKAEGGTFFLDEVGSLPAGIQALFLESRRRNAQLRRLISRMGTFRATSTKEMAAARASVVPGVEFLLQDQRIAVDVVMLTASNLNLHDEEVADTIGFRRDLLNDLGAPIYLPPLNERREDIPEIFEQIVRQIVERLGRPAKYVDDRVIGELQGRDWTKKNIVALRQIAEHAVIAAKDFDEILVRHLPPPVVLPNWAGSRQVTAGGTSQSRTVAIPAGDAPKQARTVAELSKLLDSFVAPGDPAELEAVLPALQGAYARLVLRLFGAALRTTRDRRGKTSSLRAVCKVLGIQGPNSRAETTAAYSIVGRIVRLCDTHFEGLSAERCALLSDDQDVKERVQEAISKRGASKRGNS